MHSSFPKGTTIFIIFKSGETTTGKFKDHKSGKVILEDGRNLDLENIRAMSPRRLQAGEEKSHDKRKVIFRTKN